MGRNVNWQSVPSKQNRSLMHGLWLKWVWMICLRQILGSVSFKEPRMPVYSNVSGEPFGSGGGIPALLARQLVEPVRWEGTLGALVRGARKERLFELGPGAQIKAMVKRVDMGVWKAMRSISV